MTLTSSIVADEGGTLRVKQVEDFADSKGYLGFSKVIAGAKTHKQRSAPVGVGW